MDYCSSCRRHLNGALVCPGCGAYAPDIAPVTTGGRNVPAPAAAPLWSELDETPGTEPTELAEAAAGVAPMGEGRAARRRQRARWKKNQRRAVVATAVALVGGGLTVSSMNRGSGQNTQASTAPDTTSMGVAETAAQEADDVPPAGTGKHRKPQTAAASSRSATNGGVSHRRTPVTAAHTDSTGTQPYTAATPDSTTAESTSTQQTAGTSTSDTSTTTTASQSPSSTSAGGTTSASSGSSDSSGTSSTSGSSSSTSDSSTSTATTSPSGICLLGLVCVS